MRYAQAIFIFFVVLGCAGWFGGGWNSDSKVNNISVDNNIYMTNTTTAALYIRQPDGGCSKCSVDAAGTTWACASIACAGMM